MHDPLYTQLEAMTIGDAGAELSFERRLANENGWTEDHARAVIAEYRRFVWLAVRAGHPVSPSPAVDEAWHLHLCYTHSYWDDLCARVLGRALHHEPTRGGASEHARFREQYARTLASYREHFGEPRADVWPSVEVCFPDATARLLSRARRDRQRRNGLVRRAVWIVVSLSVVGTAVAGALVQGVADWVVFAGCVAAIVFGVFAVVIQARATARGRDRGDSGCTSGGCGGGCSVHHCGAGHHCGLGCGHGCGSGCSGH